MGSRSAGRVPVEVVRHVPGMVDRVQSDEFSVSGQMSSAETLTAWARTAGSASP